MPNPLLIAPVFELAGKVFDRIFPDKEAAARAKLEMMQMASEHEFKEWAARADIVKTEAASGNWLTAAWRPVTMLTFTALIVARWFGFAAPDLAEAEYLQLWSIVELGLGGYVIGRSAEKVIPEVAKVLKKS